MVTKLQSQLDMAASMMREMVSPHQSKLVLSSSITNQLTMCYCCLQLEEKNAMVTKLQSQLDMAASMMKGSVSPENIKLVLPTSHMRSPSAMGLSTARASFTGSGAF